MGVGLASFSLGCALPSAGSAEVFPSLFGSFIGTMAQRLLQNVHARIMDLSPSRTGLLAQTFWRPPGSRAHCLLACLDSSTTPGPAATRDLTRLADVAFPLTEKGRHPVACFRSSIILPASPLSMLRCHPSRDHRQDSRPEWIRFSFSVGLSHPLQCAGLSRRSPSPKNPGGAIPAIVNGRPLTMIVAPAIEGSAPKYSLHAW